MGNDLVLCELPGRTPERTCGQKCGDLIFTQLACKAKTGSAYLVKLGNFIITATHAETLLSEAADVISSFIFNICHFNTVHIFIFMFLCTF